MKRLTTTGGVLLALLAVGLTCAFFPGTGEASDSGALRVVVSGLPPGQPGAFILRGPGTQRKLRGRLVELPQLRSGRYRLVPKRVRMTRAGHGIRTGAVAYPATGARRIRVVRGQTGVVRVAYGSIVNPGVVALPDAGLRTVGDPSHPRAIILTGETSLRRGQIVTAGPSAALPAGLVSRITAARRGAGGSTLRLEPVAVTEAAPVIDTGGPAQVPNQARASSLLGIKVEADIAGKCGLSGQDELSPIVRVGEMRVDADIDATPWGGEPKADLVVSANWTFGFKLSTARGIYCKKELVAPQVPFAIPVGPVLIPGYVALPVTAKISLTGETNVKATYSWTSEVGMRTRRAGVFLVPRPVFSVSRPSASLSYPSKPKLAIEGAVDFQAGLGVRNVGDVSFKAGTSLEAEFAPASCRLDWKLGNFSVAGQVGPLSIGTPDSAAFTHRVWTGCGRQGGAGSPGVGGGGGGGSGPSTQFGPVTVFPLPSGNGLPWDIVAGPDGNMWFTSVEGGAIGRVTPMGVITEFPRPNPDGGPGEIAVAADGHLWFTAPNISSLGEVTMAGDVTEYPLSGYGGTVPTGVSGGPDGNVWFTTGNAVSKWDAAGVVTDYPLPSNGEWCGSTAMPITAGPDGALWFASCQRVGRITTGGSISGIKLGEYGEVFIWEIVAGPDGNLWVAASGYEPPSCAIVRVNPNGATKWFDLGSEHCAFSLGFGPDGDIWFVEQSGHRVSRMTSAGQITTYPYPPGWGLYLGGIVAGPDGNIWTSTYSGIVRITP